MNSSNETKGNHMTDQAAATQTYIEREIDATWDMHACGDITDEQARDAMVELLTGTAIDNRTHN